MGLRSRRPQTGEFANFFYDCLCGHGPRPHELYAWHFAEGYFPAERVLPIYGYPFEVRVRCLDCEVMGHRDTIYDRYGGRQLATSGGCKSPTASNL